MGLRLDVRWADLVERLAGAGWRPVVGVVAVVVMGVGGCLALRSEERAAAVVLPRAGPAPALTATASGEADGVGASPEIVVHAAGAVRRPGVYRMTAAARVIDLLDAAGGPGPGADLSGINLAAALPDGVRVYFPRLGEDAPPEVEVVPVPSGHGAPGDSRPGAASVPVVLDVNVATAAELEGLPGIGPVTAAAIVEHRERVGPFRSVEALQDVTGIGPVKLSRVAHLVTVGS